MRSHSERHAEQHPRISYPFSTRKAACFALFCQRCFSTYQNAEPYVTTGGSGECGQWEKSARVYASKVQKGGEPSNTGARSGGRERAEGMIDTAHIWGVEVWR